MLPQVLRLQRHGQPIAPVLVDLVVPVGLRIRIHVLTRHRISLPDRASTRVTSRRTPRTPIRLRKPPPRRQHRGVARQMLPEILRLLRSGEPRTPLLVHLVIPVGLRLLVDEIPNHPDIP